jgi:hypothetical protein
MMSHRAATFGRAALRVLLDLFRRDAVARTARSR